MVTWTQAHWRDFLVRNSASRFLQMTCSSPTFVWTLAAELAVDSFFGPIMRGAVAALGRLVDCHGTPIVDLASVQQDWSFLVRCGLLYHCGQGEADRLCIPACDGLRAQVLRECHGGALGGHFGRAKTGSLMRRLAFWVGQDVDVADYVRSCQTCQCTLSALSEDKISCGKRYSL